MSKKIRVYCDTSVFGGIKDDEFSLASKEFFKEVKKGRFVLVTSAVVEAEMEPAPLKIKHLFKEVFPNAEVISVTDKVLKLRDAYLNKKIVSKKYSDDALHVALASVNKCSMIVSWNFKHIVHFEKIALYNAINKSKGYLPINIYSPMEVINYEN